VQNLFLVFKGNTGSSLETSYLFSLNWIGLNDASPAMAASSLIETNLINPGFEQPGTGKISTGFASIPGWTNAGSAYTDSGVELSDAESGSYAAYCRAGDSGALQIINYKINAGDLINLTWWAVHTGGSTGASTQLVCLVSAPLLATGYVNTILLVSTNSVLNGTGSTPGIYQQYNLTYTATSSDAGAYLGVYFNNATTAGNNYASFDNFNLAVTSLPSVPNGLTAIAGDGQLMLNWRAASHATGYTVKCSTVSGGPYFVVATNISGLAFTNTGLSDGVVYYSVVSGANILGESANSMEASARPTSSLATNLSFAYNGGQLQLCWPFDHTGWTLQEQTNTLGLDLTTNWINVLGANITNQIFVPLNSTSGSVFYRLMYP
jgi:hypothetical protein